MIKSFVARKGCPECTQFTKLLYLRVSLNTPEAHQTLRRDCQWMWLMSEHYNTRRITTHNSPVSTWPLTFNSLDTFADFFAQWEPEYTLYLSFSIDLNCVITCDSFHSSYSKQARGETYNTLKGKAGFLTELSDKLWSKQARSPPHTHSSCFIEDKRSGFYNVNVHAT